METRVVAPNTGVGIDGEDGREELGEKEEEEGDIKRSSFENELFFEDAFEEPESRYNDGDEVDKEHLVEFKNFTGLRPEEEGSEEEKREEGEAEELVNFVCLGHGNSLA